MKNKKFNTYEYCDRCGMLRGCEKVPANMVPWGETWVTESGNESVCRDCIDEDEIES